MGSGKGTSLLPVVTYVHISRKIISIAKYRISSAVTTFFLIMVTLFFFLNLKSKVVAFTSSKSYACQRKSPYGVTPPSIRFQHMALFLVYWQLLLPEYIKISVGQIVELIGRPELFQEKEILEGRPDYIQRGRLLKPKSNLTINSLSHFLGMIRFASVTLALLVVATFLTSSDAWWRRRRRRSCSAVHCQVGSWSSWSSCSRLCGGGTMSRTRSKTVNEYCGGGCAYHLRETRACNTNCCPVDCLFSWSAWSSCNGCGMSSHSRTPIISRHSSCNGRACPGRQTRSCNTNV